MWYVIQTMSGSEEKLIDSIHRLVDKSTYEHCFFIRYENIWKKQGKVNISLETLFPGYVFIDTKMPKRLYLQLKRVPMFSALLKQDTANEEFYFMPIYKEEEEFLRNVITDEEFIMRLSYVIRNSDKKIVSARGPLQYYMNRITNVDFKHRRVLVKVNLFQKEIEVKFCIYTDDDMKLSEGLRISRNILADKKAQDSLASEKTQDICSFKVGDYVQVVNGLYENHTCLVKRIHTNKKAAVLQMPMFGTVVDVEVKIKDLRKI